jgi:pimeloyl-ACP methyl ester carboxylesterase
MMKALVFALVSAAVVGGCTTHPSPAPAGPQQAGAACTRSGAAMVVQRDGVRLAASAQGAGPGVLLIPSLGRGPEDFDQFAAALVRDGRRVIRYEPRWFGASEGPESADLFALADDALAVADALCGAPVDIVGHAFGNRVARAAASARPDAVRSVVLLAAGGMTPLSPPMLAAIEGSVSQGVKPDAERLVDLQTAFFAKGQDPALWLTGWSPRAATLQAAATQRTPRERWWGAGVAPIMVIQASEDPVAPPANGEALRAAAPDRVTALRLDHASHAMLPEQPAAMAAAVTAWLRGSRDAAELQSLIDERTVKPRP